MSISVLMHSKAAYRWASEIKVRMRRKASRREERSVSKVSSIKINKSKHLQRKSNNNNSNHKTRFG